MKSDVTECGNNIDNIENTMKRESDQSDYLSYINSKSHILITEELDIKSENEYEQDKIMVGEGDNLDTGQ